MRPLPAITLLITMGAACASAPEASPPGYVQSIERRRPEPRSPAAAPADWLLAFIDVETTGLVPGWHEMIDIGIAITDVDGRMLDSLFLRIQPQHPERLSEGARAVNAFDAAKWKTLPALTPEAAVDSIFRFQTSPWITPGSPARWSTCASTGPSCDCVNWGKAPCEDQTPPRLPFRAPVARFGLRTSATRAFTRRLTSAVASGLSIGNRTVPFEVS